MAASSDDRTGGSDVGTTEAQVPMLDLREQLRRIRAEVDAAVNGVMDRGAFCLGYAVSEFERAFAEYCGTAHCVGVNSGTSALHLALVAAGVGPGDEVITTPFTFVSTAWAITYAGATPVFVDVDPRTFTISPDAVRAAVTPKTKAVIPVHLYGQSADMDPVREIASTRGLAVVEDAAQAHGATYGGRRCGSMGTAGCFSFYPTKNLGACGEGGAVTTDDAGLAERVRRLRNHAQAERHLYPCVGYNNRMEGIQAAVLGVKLKYLDGWNEARRCVAGRYDAGLRDLPGVTTPAVAAYASHVYHVYAIQLADRDAREDLRAHLDAAEIATVLHYPVPLHLQEVYRHLGGSKGDCPVAERASECNLGLPVYPEIPEASVERVIAEVRSWAQP